MRDSILQAISGKLGVQAWSLREELASDVGASYRVLKNLGFNEVELYGLHGMPAAELAALLETIGIKATAYHGLIEDWRRSPLRLFAEAETLGITRLGIAWLKSADGETVGIDHIEDVIGIFRREMPEMKRRGLRPYYHIHGYEFAPHGDGTLLDVLLEGLKDTDVEYELDVFWVQHAGQSVIEVMDRLSDRLTMLHLKDMRAGTVGDFSGETAYENFVPVGQGVLDFPAILKKAVELDVETYWIEDESPTPREGLPVSLAYFESKKGTVL